MTTKESIYKEIEKYVVELQKRNYDGPIRVNEWNLHTYKLSELRGFLQLYRNELEKIILKEKRNIFFQTENGKKFKQDIEHQLQLLEENFCKTSKIYFDVIYNILNEFFSETEWKIKLYHNKAIIGLIDEFGNILENYTFNIFFRKDFSNNTVGRLVINIESFNDFNLITNVQRPIFIDCLNLFLKQKERHEVLLSNFNDWNKLNKEYNNEFKKLNTKLFNPFI